MSAADYPPDLLNALAGLAAALKTDNDGQIIVKAAERKRGGDQNARYQALVEQIPAITFTLNLEEGLPDVYVGPQIETILGFTQKEWMEDPILWFYQCHPDDRSILHQEFTRGIATGGPFRAQVRVHAKDGHVVWIHGEAKLVRDDNGNPLFLQGIAFDISEQKRAEQQIKDAQEMKVLNERLSAVGQMAASIGHDLRNPLAAIRNSWHFIQGKLDPAVLADKRMKAMAGLIDRELVHAGTIINELLQYSRDRAPYRQPTALAPLFDEAISVVSKPAATMLVLNEVPEDLVAPNIDREQFRQVLVNLLQNAVEAIGPDGRVSARARAKDVNGEAGVVIEVVDNGKGIAPELKDNIWKPLFTTKAKGTGLGLPIVANVVQRHEGMVFVDSAPGRGTTFRIHLPVGTASEGPAPMQGGAAGDALSGPSPNAGATEVRYVRDVEAVRESTILKELIAECLSVVQKPAETMQVLNLVSQELPPVDVDRQQLRQALVNLMQNGVEAIGPDGTVKTKARVEGDDVVIEVIDNGCGVAVQLLSDIWKPLFTTKTRGSGLGLPMVKAVAQRHGGDVELVSAPGQGSTFRLRFPRLKPATQPETPETKP